MSLMSFVNVIFQSCEHRRFNELKYYVTETENPPGQIKLNLSAWLNTMSGEIIYIFWKGFAQISCQTFNKHPSVFESVQVCHYADGNPCKIPRSAEIPGRSCNNTDIAVPLYFPNPSFSIQIRHFIGSGLFLFSSKTIPPPLLRRLTDSCVCACIIISFTEPVCCRSLWQTSITQH